jgi:hypothetical protein
MVITKSVLALVLRKKLITKQVAISVQVLIALVPLHSAETQKKTIS